MTENQKKKRSKKLSYSFKINISDKTLARLRKKWQKIPINKIRNGRGDITNDTTEMKGIMRIVGQLHANKLDN